jgi:hypothetical protein
LVGDTYLPRGTEVRPTGKKGYYRVYYNGTELGSLEPGGPGGRFRGNGTPLPEQAYEQINPGYRAGGSQQQPDDGSVPLGGDAANDPATGITGSGGTPPTGFLTQLFGPDQFRANVDPGYQFRLQQGTQGILNGAAARTGALSGPALRGLIDYNQAAGSQEYGASFDRFQTQQGNIYQRLLGLAGLGQSAAAGTGQQGVATGAQIGANIIGAGNAAAAGQVGAANAYGSAFGDLGSLALLAGPLRSKEV